MINKLYILLIFIMGSAQSMLAMEIPAEQKYMLSEGLRLAATSLDFDQTVFLIKAGADVNHLGVYDETPLMGCMLWQPEFIDEKETVEMCSLLINAGADVNHADINGHTALMAAASFDLKEVCKLLCEKRANITHMSNRGSTALSIAARANNKPICELLVEKMLIISPCNARKEIENIPFDSPIKKQLLQKFFPSKQ